MSSQNPDGIEYTIEENDKPVNVEQPQIQQPPQPPQFQNSKAFNDLPPEIRSKLPESFGEPVNHSDAYIEFLKKHKETKEGNPVFNGHPKDYLDFLAKQNK
jgi:hypothetical protein